MAARKLFEPSTALYQDGRGSEPMIEVGSTTPADALYMGISSRLFLSHSPRSRHARESGHPVTPGMRIVRPRRSGSPLSWATRVNNGVLTRAKSTPKQSMRWAFAHARAH